MVDPSGELFNRLFGEMSRDWRDRDPKAELGVLTCMSFTGSISSFATGFFPTTLLVATSIR